MIAGKMKKPEKTLSGNFMVELEGKIISGQERLVVEMRDIQITVETAKSPNRPWRYKEQIEAARASYRAVWGDIPLWDEYDELESTFNYIAFVSRPKTSGGELVVEALSNRMVLEEPEDLTFYQLGGVSLTQALPELLYRKRGIEHRIIAGESRIGAIRPPPLKSNLQTLEAFAAIKLKMVEDARALGIEYIACQLKPELASSVFNKSGITYEFPFTEEILGLSPGSIRLDRNNPVVKWHILNYPGYFLDHLGVYNVVRELVSTGELSGEALTRLTGLASVDELTKPRNVKGFVPLIHQDTPLGDILRTRLLQDVPDGTYSSLSHVDQIEKRALRVLREITSLHC